jgi:septal ring factor EnvC (AmiA/AmiB activator)
VEGRIASSDGIGRDLILDFLHDTPGINAGSVRQQLSNLKTSGHYARIVQEVEAEIAQEQQAARAALARAEAEQARQEQERREAEARAADERQRQVLPSRSLTSVWMGIAPGCQASWPL